MDKKKYIAEFHFGKCDKCGGKVSRGNSALLVQEIATERTAGFVMNRHLYPTGICGGSPSRVLLVETDPVWARGYDLVVSQVKEWTKDWPTEPGAYWFYGWAWDLSIRFQEPPELHFVTAHPDSQGRMVYVTNGHFLFKEEGARGLWAPADLPELPDLAEGEEP